MINIIGTFFGTSGYDIHTRQLANALDKITDVRVSTNLMPGWETVCNDAELAMIKKSPELDEINLIITNPVHWRMNTTQKRNWVFLVWEGDSVPKSIVRECFNTEIEYIFVPSNHTKEALLNSELENPSLLEILEKKIKIIPHGVNLNTFYPKKKDKPKFTFAANKGFRNLEDRGGIQYLLRAYIEEFTPEDNVRLILKINPAYGVPDMQKVIEQLTNKRDNIPQIDININSMPYEELVEFYNEADVFVSPTRAEAFNLPCLEAMACGLPVLTTNFGGQLDYVNEDNGWLIEGKMTEVNHEVMYEGISWATPDIDSLRKQMREIYAGGPHDEKAKKAKEKAESMPWSATAQKIKDLM